MKSLALRRPVLKILTLDVVLCALAVAVPALSHAAAFPVYYLDPMRWLVFGAILLSRPRNAVLMAVWLPLLSLLTSGHPVFPKVVLIQGELALNVLLFYAVARRTHSFAAAALVSVVMAKLAYYAAKFLLIRTALLDGDLVATPWLYQLGAVAGVLLIAGLVGRSTKTDKDRA